MTESWHLVSLMYILNFRLSKFFLQKKYATGKVFVFVCISALQDLKAKNRTNLNMRENQKRERTHILVVFTFVLRPAFRGRPLHSGKDGKYLHSIASIVLHSGKDWKYSEFSRLVTKLAAFMSTVYYEQNPVFISRFKL